MEPLRLKLRQPVEEVVENWDDDDFMIEGDDIAFRSSTNTAPAPSNSRRNSHSSLRSDFESVHAEEDQQVLLPGDDEKSTLDAIALAANAGVPLPTNVPPSALMGGTIKRLGGRKINKIFQEDWGEDLVFPEGPQPLHIKTQDASQFPDAIRRVSGGSTLSSPVRPTQPGPTLIRPEQMGSVSASSAVMPAFSPKSTTPITLDQFRDSDDDDDFFGDGTTTIKVSKTRQAPKPISLITPPTPQKLVLVDEDMEMDFELPSDGKLTLSKRKDIPKTPSSVAMDDFDCDGSIGIRFGGRHRDGHGSSVSAMSPSVSMSSSITAESEGEDDTFEGLVLPTGKLDFGERLQQRRRRSRSPNRAAKASEDLQLAVQIPTESQTLAAALAARQVIVPAKQAPSEKEDFLAGLDLGDGEVLDTKRRTLHRNVRVKETRPASPSRVKVVASVTFTSKTSPVVSRLPRPQLGHERTHTASSLEPVSESGGPISSVSRRSQSRMGHSAHSSVSSIPTPSTPSSTQSMPAPFTPRRRDLGQKSSTASLRDGPPTTNAQLLRLKRSMPAMRQAPCPAPRPLPSRGGYERPPSRSDAGARPPSAMRPKTPVDRPRPTVESAAAQARKNPLPFLPAGASHSTSHHVGAKSLRSTFRRHDSDTSVDMRPSSRTVSRSTIRSPSPPKKGHASHGSWQQLNKPRRQRLFGDGHELDAFDDLPTSSQTESRYLRQPATASAKLQMRTKMYNNILPDRTNSPSPITPYNPSARLNNLPHFARDTTASRIARETSLAQRAPSGPLSSLPTQRVTQLSTRNTYSTPHVPRDTIRSKKTPRRPVQQKPHLISNLGGAKETKTLNGMCYNPDSMRWEGNETALSAFDPPASSPSTTSIPPYLVREKEASTPRPALITPIGATKGVQVVGGMVFDPQNMCWLKLGPQNASDTSSKTEADDSMDGFNGIDSDDDPFKDIPDLDDGADTTEVGTGGRVSEVKDDWLVGEEFDVGPEFIRRQREEEQRWRKKCERWMNFEDRNQGTWRWLLQEMVTHPM